MKMPDDDNHSWSDVATLFGVLLLIAIIMAACADHIWQLIART